MIDVHIADSVEAASRQEPVFGIQLDVHRLIAEQIAKDVSKLPILSRLHDAFADAKVDHGELLGMSKEISLLKAIYSDDRNQEAETLQRLKLACEQAHKLGKHIYLLAD